jgi:hypothetical protein
VLYFRDGQLVRILGRLVWFESNSGHIIIQEHPGSHGPRDLESVRWAIIDLRDEVGSVHKTLYGMQNVADDRWVEQVVMKTKLRELSVNLSSLEDHFEKFVLDEWVPFQAYILQALSTVAFAGQACL